MKPLRSLVVWCVLVLLGVSMVGCNTVRGVGQDIERAGQAIHDAFE
jgi:predicted small secreted protein